MRVFKHSIKDSALVSISIFQIALLLSSFVFWENWKIWQTLIAGLIWIALVGTNFQCIAHNFIHNPFFKSQFLNRVFSIINSFALGLPQSLYFVHHMNHHEFNNDHKDLATGDTRDLSSIYRYSKNEATAQEGIITYSVIGPFRTDFRVFYKWAKKYRLFGQSIRETAALILMAAVSLYLKPSWFFFFYLPVWYLAQVVGYAENYLEHHKANSTNRLTNSVSCYNPLYNWVWFNNGFHQEHHCFPRIHWTLITKYRVKMLPEARRRVVSGSHWFSYWQ